MWTAGAGWESIGRDEHDEYVWRISDIFAREKQRSKYGEYMEMSMPA